MKSGIIPRKSNYIQVVAHLGCIVAVTAWGSSFLSTKVLMEVGHFTPVEMFVYRFFVAYVILLLCTFKKIFSNSLKDEISFFICGACAGSLYFITENYALLNTTAGNVSLLSAMSPIFTTILMAIVFRTRISGGVVIGSIIAFAGVFCIIFSHGEGFVIKPLGDLLALSSALSWAIYSIVSKRLLPFYSSFFITRKIFFYGVLTALPLLIFTHDKFRFLELFNLSNPHFLFNFLFLVIFCSLLAYIIWNECMRILGPVATNNYIYMQPLVTMIAAYILLGEKIFLLGYIGCVLIIGGLIIADKLKFKSNKK